MEKIASFTVDHDLLTPGIYLSRTDGDIITYDLRFITPNVPPFLPSPVMHTIEHLFATFARNSAYKDRVIYFGPMGCRTGFYFLLRDVDKSEAIQLIIDIVKQITEFFGDIPGATRKECGNFLEQDLSGAKAACKEYLKVIEHWTVPKLTYRS